MNILLVSDLYPASRDHSPTTMSRALHQFARQWSLSDQVMVLRPFLVPDWRGENRRQRAGTDQIDGVAICHAPVWKLPWLRCFFLAGLRRALRASGFRPEVIVAHLGFNLLFGSRLASRLQVPLVAAVHLGDLRCGPAMLGRKRLREVYGHAAAIACRSPIILQCFAVEYPEFKGKCFVAYSGIDSSWLQGGAGEAGRFAGWPQQKPVVFCTLASLLECKCIDGNLQALARLSPEIDWHYKIIGDGPEKSSLQKRASSLGIADRVTFMGFLPRELARRELLSSHVFLMASRDTFGLAYLEAMACGLLVVGGRGFGIDGILVDGENGFLCAPGDTDELAALLQRITTEMNEQDLRAILASARETISRYTMEKAAANYLGNIRRTIGAAPGE